MTPAGGEGEGRENPKGEKSWKMPEGGKNWDQMWGFGGKNDTEWKKKHTSTYTTHSL